ncbi:MAG TPA: UPF0280 family protein [Terriglobales bacterium]|nr:UPF0280 family protein [Terriglobales bacterium]
MNHRAQIRFLPDGNRLHMQDGPIDLIVEAFGAVSEVKAAFRAAAMRFVEVLDELCGELAFLRRSASNGSRLPSGVVARRMFAAVQPYAPMTFITPMAAVAGAVAEEILAVMTSNANLSRAYVNDGGDIALHLSAGERFVVGMVERPDRTSLSGTTLFGTTTIDFSDSIRGIATSGWRGRSFSFGIADAVTVLADTAAMADAAATVIANAVDLQGHPNILRTPACELETDSDLGTRLVTCSVGELTADDVSRALGNGVEVAKSLRDLKLIRAAALDLQGTIQVVGGDCFSRLADNPVADRSAVHA